MTNLYQFAAIKLKKFPFYVYIKKLMVNNSELYVIFSLIN